MSEAFEPGETEAWLGLLAKWSGCWCGPQEHEDHDPRVRDCPQHGSDDCRHMAEGICVDLRALTTPPAHDLTTRADVSGDQSDERTSE